MGFDPGKIAKAAVALMVINDQKGTNLFQLRTALTKPLQITAVQTDTHNIIAAVTDKGKDPGKICFHLIATGQKL